MKKIALLERILKDYKGFYKRRKKEPIPNAARNGICRYLANTDEYTCDDCILFNKIHKSISPYYSYWFWAKSAEHDVACRIDALERLIKHLKNKKGINEFNLYKVYNNDGVKK